MDISPHLILRVSCTGYPVFFVFKEILADIKDI